MKLDFLFGAAKRQLRLSEILGRIFVMAFCLGAMPVLGGCSLALDELSPENGRLAGVFVTREPIEPALPDLELNARGEIVAKDTGSRKIYGTFTGYDENAPIVTFPDLDGYGVYSLTAPEDETHEAAGFNSADFPFSNLFYNFSDQEDSIEANLYVGAARFAKYYFNPVYQQEDGQIYLLAGSGVSTDSFYDGQKFSHGISESVSRTENGDQTAHSLSFTVNIIASGLPREPELLLMDGENRLTERYSGEQLEELASSGKPLALPESTSYLILRQSIEGKEHDSHSIFDRDAEYVEYMVPGEDGYLYFRQLYLAWP